MSELVKLKNRIKAIQTTEKVTKAMRLISMSLHAKLKNRADAIQKYDAELTNLFNSVQAANKEWKSSLLSPEKNNGKTLLILIGSQKGLCGTFNAHLFNFFENKIKHISNVDFIGIGKKACDFLNKQHAPVHNFSNLAPSKINDITNKLFNLLFTGEAHYKEVLIIYNYPKSFLTQVPTLKQIIPTSQQFEEKQNTESYVWEQPINEVLDLLAEEYLKFTLQTTISNSLLAEQSARFKSMDSAARNAENLLSDMQRQYSKQRQAKITKELIEISGAF